MVSESDSDAMGVERAERGRVGVVTGACVRRRALVGAARRRHTDRRLRGLRRAAHRARQVNVVFVSLIRTCTYAYSPLTTYVDRVNLI